MCTLILCHLGHIYTVGIFCSSDRSNQLNPVWHITSRATHWVLLPSFFALSRPSQWPYAKRLTPPYFAPSRTYTSHHPSHHHSHHHTSHTSHSHRTAFLYDDSSFTHWRFLQSKYFLSQTSYRQVHHQSHHHPYLQNLTQGPRYHQRAPWLRPSVVQVLRRIRLYLGRFL